MSKSRPRGRSVAELIVGRIGMVLVALAAVAGLVVLILWLVDRGSDDATGTGEMSVRVTEEDGERPVVTVATGDEELAVAPWVFCDPARPDLCDEEGEVVEFAVDPAGELTVAVPGEFADAPWVLEAFYLETGGDDDAHGSGESLVGDEQTFPAGQTDPVTVPGADEDGRPLAGIEVRLPTGIMLIDEESGAEEEQIVSHAIWSIRTR